MGGWVDKIDNNIILQNNIVNGAMVITINHVIK